MDGGLDTWRSRRARRDPDVHAGRCEALAVRAQTLLAVGTTAEIEKLKEKKTDVVDLKGRFVYPGFAWLKIASFLAFQAVLAFLIASLALFLWRASRETSPMTHSHRRSPHRPEEV